jgi:hypothetical protein
MKAMLDASVKMESPTGRAKAPKPFSVWCEFHEHDAVVLVQWDEMGRLSDDDRESLAKMIWQTACLTTRHEPARGVGSHLTVGMKERFRWTDAFVGKLPPLDQVADGKPAQTITGNEVEARLVSAFSPVMAQ